MDTTILNIKIYVNFFQSFPKIIKEQGLKVEGGRKRGLGLEGKGLGFVIIIPFIITNIIYNLMPLPLF
jgi:hypothetical protein